MQLGEIGPFARSSSEAILGVQRIDLLWTQRGQHHEPAGHQMRGEHQAFTTPDPKHLIALRGGYEAGLGPRPNGEVHGLVDRFDQRPHRPERSRAKAGNVERGLRGKLQNRAGSIGAILRLNA